MRTTKIIREAKGIALGVQTSYAEALDGMPHSCGPMGDRSGDKQDDVPPSIGYQCPVYSPLMKPAPLSAGDETINVGGKMQFHD